MREQLLIGIGVIDIGGTYNPKALPSPLGQLAKIYKVFTQDRW